MRLPKDSTRRFNSFSNDSKVASFGMANDIARENLRRQSAFAYLAWFAVHLIRPPATFSPSDAEKELFCGTFSWGGACARPPRINPKLISFTPSAYLNSGQFVNSVSKLWRGSFILRFNCVHLRASFVDTAISFVRIRRSFLFRRTGFHVRKTTI